VDEGKPKGLNLDRWWRKAACLGLKVDTITRHHCWGCQVQNECLWVAITEDDRGPDHPLFIRGGLGASKREDLWYWSDKDSLKTYAVCKIEADRIQFAAKRRKKTKRVK